MTSTTMQQPNTDRASRRYYVKPRVDVVETSGAVVLMADVPGVTQEHLDITVDHDVLTIRGAIDAGVHATRGQEAEVYRKFKLSDRIDRDQIEAELKHGVLTLTLPKAEAAKTRQIEVNIS